MKQTKDKLTKIREKIQNLELADDEDYQALIENILNISSRADFFFKNAKMEHKRKLLNLVLSKLELKGEKIVYEYNSPFNILAKYSNHTQWQGMRDSNSRRLGS